MKLPETLMVYLIIGVFVALGLATWLRPWPLFPQEEDSAMVEDQNTARLFRRWVQQQAFARGLNVRGVARPVPMECRKCGKASNHFIYPDEICERCWRSELAEMSARTSGNRPQSQAR